MLTRELAIARYERGQIIPDRLTRPRHAAYVAHAERLQEIYRSGIGRTRAELHCAVRQVFEREPECPPRRVGAFA